MSHDENKKVIDAVHAISVDLPARIVIGLHNIPHKADATKNLHSLFGETFGSVLRLPLARIISHKLLLQGQILGAL